jgi:hypothetical protein
LARAPTVREGKIYTANFHSCLRKRSSCLFAVEAVSRILSPKMVERRFSAALWRTIRFRAATVIAMTAAAPRGLHYPLEASLKTGSTYSISACFPETAWEVPALVVAVPDELAAPEALPLVEMPPVEEVASPVALVVLPVGLVVLSPD